MQEELKILSGDEFELLLFHIDQLPYNEGKLLEEELKDTYRQCPDTWYELETLVREISSKRSG